MKSSPSLKKLSVEEIKAERCKRRFYNFFLEFWETIEAVELVPNWHIEFLCDRLEAVYEAWEDGDRQKDIYINVPPGTSKSTSISQLFPAWLWVKNPSIRIISSSYAADLSTAHAVKTRDCLKSDKFQLYFPNHIQFKEDSDNKTNYQNTKKGQRFTTSTGGAVTGMHGDFIIVDDPINPKGAASEKDLKSANEHISQTLSTRKTDKKRTVTIVVMQRLHEADPTGTALKERPDKIEHICLPGEISKRVKPEECKEYYINGLLDPNRLDRETLNGFKSVLGSYGYSGQFDQNPSPEEGGKLKRAWFKKISYAEFKTISEGKTVNFFGDTAYTEKQKNDPSAFMATSYFNKTLYIIDSTPIWLEFPDLLKYLSGYIQKHGYTNSSRVMIEPKASGKSLVQSFRTSGFNVLELPTPEGDKSSRVSNISAFVESLRVVLVEGPWNEGFVDECAGFPTAKHDDQVDNLCNAVTYYSKSGGRVRSTLPD